MESSEWPRTAIFAGVTTFLGNWAECLRSQGPGIRGQYCLPELRYDFFVDKTYDPPSPRWVDWPEEYESIWSIIQSVKFKDDSVLLINVLVSNLTIKMLIFSIEHYKYEIRDRSSLGLYVFHHHVQQMTCKNH